MTDMAVSSQTAGAKTSADKPRILVVDDSPTIRKVVTGILERHGYETVAAADGQLALDALEGDAPPIDLVLLDFVMPRMNGFQFCRTVRGSEKYAALPVVLMSAKSDKIRDQLKSGIVVLAGEKDGKANLLVAVTPDLSKKYRAGDLVKELSKTLGGRGGGKPELAQAGGGDPARLDAALARAYEIV